MECHRTDSTITPADRRDHVLARWGVRRGSHRVEPGLYALGDPTPESPVLVTANYTLSFDALRSSLAGRDAFLLVLDTKGINVWCAAGKGTFGTEELAHRIESTGLADVVEHRKLILPQLGAPGVAAHEVRSRTGFRVEYGPVRAADLPSFLDTGRATPEMRRVRFPLADRAVLVPVELVGVLVLLVPAAVGLWLTGGSWALQAMVAVLAAAVLFPILLPWLPTHDFSTKGFFLGALAAIPFAAHELIVSGPDVAVWRQAGAALADLLIWIPVTAFLALNFTGATTYTSRTGVRREIFRYVPVMAAMLVLGVALAVVPWLI